VVVSIAVPGFRPAVHGFSPQRQFGRHSECYQRMARVLAGTGRNDDATTIGQVRDVAAAAEQVMREDNNGWFGVIRFGGMELFT
jgi:hypothetical protein